jgi:hypothetical protein
VRSIDDASRRFWTQSSPGATSSKCASASLTARGNSSSATFTTAEDMDRNVAIFVFDDALKLARGSGRDDTGSFVVMLTMFNREVRKRFLGALTSKKASTTTRR